MSNRPTLKNRLESGEYIFREFSELMGFNAVWDFEKK